MDDSSSTDLDSQESSVSEVLSDSSFEYNSEGNAHSVIEISTKQPQGKHESNIKPRVFCSDKMDNSYYIAKNIGKFTSIMKWRNLDNCWKSPCIIHSNCLQMQCFSDLLFVAFTDNTISFIDSENGCPALPSIFIESGIHTMKLCKRNHLCIISNDNTIRIWKISGYNSCESIFKHVYPQKLPKIVRIKLTFSNENLEIVPILMFNQETTYFSPRANYWVSLTRTLPEGLVDTRTPETIYQLQIQLFEQMSRNEPQFVDTLCEIIKSLSNPKINLKYLILKYFHKLLTLAIKHETYCKLQMRTILESAFQVIQDSSPELVDFIVRSPEYAVLTRETNPDVISLDTVINELKMENYYYQKPENHCNEHQLKKAKEKANTALEIASKASELVENILKNIDQIMRKQQEESKLPKFVSVEEQQHSKVKEIAIKTDKPQLNINKITGPLQKNELENFFETDVGRMTYKEINERNDYTKNARRNYQKFTECYNNANPPEIKPKNTYARQSRPENTVLQAIRQISNQYTQTLKTTTENTAKISIPRENNGTRPIDVTKEPSEENMAILNISLSDGMINSSEDKNILKKQRISNSKQTDNNSVKPFDENAVQQQSNSDISLVKPFDEKSIQKSEENKSSDENILQKQKTSNISLVKPFDEKSIQKSEENKSFDENLINKSDDSSIDENLVKNTDEKQNSIDNEFIVNLTSDTDSESEAEKDAEALAEMKPIQLKNPFSFPIQSKTTKPTKPLTATKQMPISPFLEINKKQQNTINNPPESQIKLQPISLKELPKQQIKNEQKQISNQQQKQQLTKPPVENTAKAEEHIDVLEMMMNFISNKRPTQTNQNPKPKIVESKPKENVEQKKQISINKEDYFSIPSFPESDDDVEFIQVNKAPFHPFKPLHTKKISNQSSPTKDIIPQSLFIPPVPSATIIRQEVIAERAQKQAELEKLKNESNNNDQQSNPAQQPAPQNQNQQLPTNIQRTNSVQNQQISAASSQFYHPTNQQKINSVQNQQIAANTQRITPVQNQQIATNTQQIKSVQNPSAATTPSQLIQQTNLQSNAQKISFVQSQENQPKLLPNNQQTNNVQTQQNPATISQAKNVQSQSSTQPPTVNNQQAVNKPPVQQQTQNIQQQNTVQIQPSPSKNQPNPGSSNTKGNSNFRQARLQNTPVLPPPQPKTVSNTYQPQRTTGNYLQQQQLSAIEIVKKPGELKKYYSEIEMLRQNLINKNPTDSNSKTILNALTKTMQNTITQSQQMQSNLLKIAGPVLPRNAILQLLESTCITSITQLVYNIPAVQQNTTNSNIQSLQKTDVQNQQFQKTDKVSKDYEEDKSDSEEPSFPEEESHPSSTDSSEELYNREEESTESSEKLSEGYGKYSSDGVKILEQTTQLKQSNEDVEENVIHPQQSEVKIAISKVKEKTPAKTDQKHEVKKKQRKKNKYSGIPLGEQPKVEDRMSEYIRAYNSQTTKPPTVTKLSESSDDSSSN